MRVASFRSHAVGIALAVVSVVGLSSWVAAQEDPKDPAAQPLVEALRQGGLVIYLRHTRTEKDYADQIDARLGDCASQRVLSEAGWHDARRIGEAIRAANVPVGEVWSSEYCRAWQTADLAFGDYRKTPALNFEPAETYSTEQWQAMRSKVSPLITREVVAGNRVIVGHDDPFEAVTGIYPEPQGVAYVLRTTAAGKIEILGRIGPHDWPGMSG